MPGVGGVGSAAPSSQPLDGGSLACAAAVAAPIWRLCIIFGDTIPTPEQYVIQDGSHSSGGCCGSEIGLLLVVLCSFQSRLTVP